jgi:hypothetical protein
MLPAHERRQGHLGLLLLVRLLRRGQTHDGRSDDHHGEHDRKDVGAVAVRRPIAAGVGRVVGRVLGGVLGRVFPNPWMTPVSCPTSSWTTWMNRPIRSTNRSSSWMSCSTPSACSPDLTPARASARRAGPLPERRSRWIARRPAQAASSPFIGEIFASLKEGTGASSPASGLRRRNARAPDRWLYLPRGAARTGGGGSSGQALGRAATGPRDHSIERARRRCRP